MISAFRSAWRACCSRPIDGQSLRNLGRAALRAMVIERNVNLPLKTAGLVPVRFAVPHKDQAGAFALLRKRLQMCGAVQAFDLHLRPINSRPQIEDRQRGVVDSESSESPLGFSEQGEHQATRMALWATTSTVPSWSTGGVGSAIHEGSGLIHQLHQRAIAAAVSPFEFQLQGLALPGGEINGWRSVSSSMLMPDQGSRSTSSSPSSNTGVGADPPRPSSREAVVDAARCSREL
ncbi:MAG: hypothetical protein CM15mP77_3110 [Synechococcus sp.]|nr:MAG: hypothetical protein CM15mP77_3110 [Synechococcus sp.]